MATYDKLVYNIPPYQEGNLEDFEFDIDVNFPIADVANITMEVREVTVQQLSTGIKKIIGELIMPVKSLQAGSITLTNRTVNIPFEPSDTKGKAGVYEYEIDFVNAQGKPFATIGGRFTINPEVNKN